jgi:hypothetical protein
MKIWVIKQFIMTKYFICSLLVMVLSGTMVNARATNSRSVKHLSTLQHTDAQSMPARPISGMPAEGLPASKETPVEHGKGSHPPAIDETPHIHHFHKHRVKKLIRHHGKCWFISQALVIICQLVLLYMAYMHVVH